MREAAARVSFQSFSQVFACYYSDIPVVNVTKGWVTFRLMPPAIRKTLAE